MEGVPIRTARRGDVPSLVLLWSAMMEENARLDPRLAAHPHAREHMAEQFAAWIADAHRIVVVAEENGRLPIGYAAARATQGGGWHEPSRVGEITDCFVAPARRRRGIARRMAGRLTDHLYERGISTVRLQVVTRNEAAVRFWEALGWQPREEILEREVPGASA
jgi:ribosomal protein S18 acetylase RimI-like enzyme